MTAREAFEKIEPVPEGIAWDEDEQDYAIDGFLSMFVATRFTDKWLMWQSIYPQIEAGRRLREALKEACDLRAALCGHSDADSEGGDPRTWDKPLKSWTEAIAGFDAVGVV